MGISILLCAKHSRSWAGRETDGWPASTPLPSGTWNAKTLRQAELERLRNENAALKKGAATRVTMKVSEKSAAVSVYGMGRFPVTLYKEQWLKLLKMSDDIREFIAANEGQLKTKE